MQELFEYIFEKPELRKLKDELSQTILFKNLTRHELDKVIKYCHLRSFKKGEHIFFEGDPGAALFIVMKGGVQIVRHVNGKHVPLATLSKGMFFGELSLVYDTPRTATGLVSEDSLFVCLFKHDFEKIVKHYPILGSKLLTNVNQILAQRLSAMIERSVKK